MFIISLRRSPRKFLICEVPKQGFYICDRGLQMMKLWFVLLLIFSVNIFGDCTECDLLKGGNCETCSQNVYSFGSGLSCFDNNMSYNIDLTYSFAYFQSINLSLKQTDKSFNDLKLIPQFEYIFYFLVSFGGGIGHDIYNENILYHLYL